MKKVSMAFDFFKKEQLNLQGDHRELVKAKEEINLRLKKIRTLLDDQLYERHSGKKKDQWFKDTQPFHWYVEFYPIMHGCGGFDVIIGNPPYVEYSPRNIRYDIGSYKTIKAANLHAFCVERSINLCNKLALRGMILPLGAISTIGMKPLMDFLFVNSGRLWTSSYHFRPSSLFSGANIPTCIFISDSSDNQMTFSTCLNKFDGEERKTIFEKLRFTKYDNEVFARFNYAIPKVSCLIDLQIIEKLKNVQSLESERMKFGREDCAIHYRTAGGLYWKVIRTNPFPYSSTSNKQSYFATDKSASAAVAFLNSSLQWFLYTMLFDSLNFKDYYIFSLPFTTKGMMLPVLEKLTGICESLMNDFDKNAKHKYRGTTPCYEIYANLSKPIIDEIDELLAKHYGFTEEELDFIINYDIKYRMGDELNA
jgi:hypothetical protein